MLVVWGRNTSASHLLSVNRGTTQPKTLPHALQRSPDPPHREQRYSSNSVDTRRRIPNLYRSVFSLSSTPLSYQRGSGYCATPVLGSKMVLIVSYSAEGGKEQGAGLVWQVAQYYSIVCYPRNSLCFKLQYGCGSCLVLMNSCQARKESHVHTNLYSRSASGSTFCLYLQ